MAQTQSYYCTYCQAPIIWNKKKREALGTRLPLNPDESIHDCRQKGQAEGQELGPHETQTLSVKVNQAEEFKKINDKLDKILNLLKGQESIDQQ